MSSSPAGCEGMDHLRQRINNTANSTAISSHPSNDRRRLPTDLSDFPLIESKQQGSGSCLKASNHNHESPLRNIQNTVQNMGIDILTIIYGIQDAEMVIILT